VAGKDSNKKKETQDVNKTGSSRGKESSHANRGGDGKKRIKTKGKEAKLNKKKKKGVGWPIGGGVPAGWEKKKEDTAPVGRERPRLRKMEK